MNTQDCLDYLYKLEKTYRRLTAKELESLYLLSRHPDPLVRGDAAALLADHYEPKSEEVLLLLSHDRDELVRTEAADSLCIGRTRRSLLRLLELAESDSCHLVRCYALASLFDVSLNLQGDSDSTYRQLRERLLPLLEKEESNWVRAFYHHILCRCGDSSYVQELLDALEDEDYHVWFIALDCLADVLDCDNAAMIGEVVEQYIDDGAYAIVQEKIDSLLAFIDEYIQAQ